MNASCTETSTKIIQFTGVEAATLLLLDRLKRIDEADWRWQQLRARLDALAAREPGSSGSAEGGGR